MSEHRDRPEIRDKDLPEAQPSDKAQPAVKKMNPWLKLATDMGPLILFFLVNTKFGIFAATGVFMVTIVAAIAISWHFTRHVPTMMWVTAFIVLVFGGLTIYLNDERFVKIKSTIIYTLFGGLLLYGLATGRAFLKVVFEAGFPPMDAAGWRLLTRNWMLLFFALAMVNEIVWRNFSTDTWVAVKSFGFLPAIFVFALLQTPIILRHQIDEEQPDP